jgi:uncharacterized protein YlxW (UPF0749 family)
MPAGGLLPKQPACLTYSSKTCSLLGLAPSHQLTASAEVEAAERAEQAEQQAAEVDALKALLQSHQSEVADRNAEVAALQQARPLLLLMRSPKVAQGYQNCVNVRASP